MARKRRKRPVSRLISAAQQFSSARRGSMAQESRSPIRLSHSSLLVLDSCPRCFWLRYNRGIFQPQGMWSGLPNRFDSIIKAYFNRYRPSGTLPPILQGKCQGRLEDPFVEDYAWRINDRYVFVGKLDECLVTAKRRLSTGKKLHTPVDHKTTSVDPRTMEALPAYGAQLDAYAFLLEKNGKKTTGYGHLIFYYPEHTDDLHEGCRLITDVKTLETDPKRTESTIKKAIEVIESPKPLLPSSECSFCDWYRKVAEDQTGGYSDFGERRLHAGRTGAIVSLDKKLDSTSPTAELKPQRKGATNWISQNTNTRYADGNLSWWAEQARKGNVIEWEMNKNTSTGRVRLDGHIMSREAARKRLVRS